MNIIREIAVVLTPLELAESFCDMDSSEQAEFFNEIGKVARLGGWSLSFQMSSVLKQDSLNEDGANAMRAIGMPEKPEGDYAEVVPNDEMS